MAFNPSSTIWLCNVPFDNSYKNVVYFANRDEQDAYFISKTRESVSEYLTVRKTLPDGSLRSSVKVGINIDTLRSMPCNYMWYYNANHGNRRYYAFVTEFIYVNEECTEIVFETDVFQTWFLDVTIKQSFVVREHAASDSIGENLVPEPFNFNDYTYAKLIDPLFATEWGYLIAASESLFESANRGYLMSGIYQGLYFYYARTASEVNEIIESLEEKASDCIVSITVIPKACLANNTIGLEESAGYGQVFTSTTYAWQDVEIDFTAFSSTYEGYVPKNNKLYTAPFQKIIVTNNSGEHVELNIEDFPDRSSVKFTLFADVSPVPSVTLVPAEYKQVLRPMEFSISLGGFPQCSYHNDMFKLWMNKSLPVSGMNLVGSMFGGFASGLVGYAVGNPFTPNAIADTAGSMASQICGIIGQGVAAANSPNPSNAGSPKNNLLTAMKKNTFEIMVRSIKKTFAKQIDDFFTMYGYQTNEVKSPNLSSRPYYNYVQTVGINIVGGIPNDDMITLKKIFDNGVTLWKPSATIGDYSVDNSP